MRTLKVINIFREISFFPMWSLNILILCYTLQKQKNSIKRVILNANIKLQVSLVGQK